MQIITAIDKNFQDIHRLTKQANIKLGYKVHVYALSVERTYLGRELPEFPDCVPFHISEREAARMSMSCWKPRLIKHALTEFEDDLVWMDADAFAIRPFDDVFDGSFDIGVTMRRPEERGRSKTPIAFGFLNAGVIFVTNTSLGSRNFLAKWASMTVSAVVDQESLNKLVLEATDLTEYDKVFIHPTLGTRIKVFKTDDYNYFHPEEPGPQTKIIHAKSNVRVGFFKRWFGFGLDFGPGFGQRNDVVDIVNDSLDATMSNFEPDPSPPSPAAPIVIVQDNPSTLLNVAAGMHIARDVIEMGEAVSGMVHHNAPPQEWSSGANEESSQMSVPPADPTSAPIELESPELPPSGS
jgi:hypothetical protein